MPNIIKKKNKPQKNDKTHGEELSTDKNNKVLIDTWALEKRRVCAQTTWLFAHRANLILEMETLMGGLN